jgi:hypothetical protein
VTRRLPSATFDFASSQCLHRTGLFFVLAFLAARYRWPSDNVAAAASSGPIATGPSGGGRRSRAQIEDLPPAVTPEVIAGLFRDHTGLQAATLVQPYVGRACR